MKYIPGNVFVNYIVASISEAVSVFVSGCMVNCLGARNAITLTNTIAGTATIVLWVAETKGWIEEVPAFILLAKFGVCSFFAMMYMSTLIYFPSRYLGAVFGLCNTAARATTILAPMVAELDTPIPELSFIMICLFSAVFSQFLKIPKNLKEE